MKTIFGFKNRLGNKFLAALGIVILVVLSSLFLLVSKRQEAQVIAQIDQQARILFDQIVLTRAWVAAQNGGVYSEVQGDIEPNPYLLEIDGLHVNITDEEGVQYTLRNPALVTRELSELLENERAYAFHITSLAPLNPDNAPTEWEQAALQSFEMGEKEDDFIIDTTYDGDVYRYIAPLYVKESCMTCHAQQGYQVGDVRGGISVTIPMTEANASIQANNLQLLLSGFFILVVTLGIMSVLVHRQISIPLGNLQEAATAIAKGELDQEITAQSDDEIGQLANAFSVMTGRLHGLIADLEERVAERTESLKEFEVQTEQLQAAAEVGRAASTILDADILMQSIVNTIRERFDLYYVGLFMTDSEREWAVLRAGTGKAGKLMLARNHQLQVNEGMIGWSIVNARSHVAEEIGEDAIRLATSELPETRSEAAIPLRARGKVIGAFTVQDTRTAAFDQSLMAVLQLMADQVGVALDNANLYAESQEALETSRRAYGQLSEDAWASLLSARDIGFREDERGTSEISENPQLSEDTKHLPELSIPIKIQNQTIGTITAHKHRNAGEWEDAEINIMQILSRQINVALESARLHEEVQRRATQEQVSSVIASRMRETLDMETILKTAASEMQKALALKEVEVRLGTLDNEKKL